MNTVKSARRTASSATTKRRLTPRKVASLGTQNVSLKLPPDVVHGLDEIAVEEGRSRNSSVRIRLTEIVALHKANKTKRGVAASV